MDGVSAQVNVAATKDIFTGGGEMGALMRNLDWSKTPLGPVENWPQSLRTSISICLVSRYPMLIWWGPELVMLYNDAYRPILGSTKHPHSMGQRGNECWPEIWDIIGPMLEGVMNTGEATWSDNQLLLLDRNGYIEECYFTFSYSPIRDETGGIGGVFTAVTETTRQVLSERRLHTLHELADRSGEAKTAEEACFIAAKTLAQYTADIPCALLYLLENEGRLARLVGNFGMISDTPLCSLTVDLTAVGENRALDAMAQVAQTGQTELLDLVDGQFDAYTTHTTNEPPRKVIILPIARPGQPIPYGIFVGGISPLGELNDDYQNFFELVAAQVANAVSKGRAYQEERERAEVLAELDRAKTSFFSNVSHEFRTPLTLMLGPIEEALSEPEQALTPQQREWLEIVHRNSLRLLKLVNNLLDFSRIEAGRLQARYEPTDLATFTAELATVFRSAMEQAKLEFIIDCPPLTETVYVDRDMWEKIVFNLLSNAFKFTFDGRITLSLYQQQEHVELRVSDTGTGIARDEVPFLFERFHRIQGARARTHEGSGIGLALVNELVRQHGGTIWVNSEPGVGTTFTVSIPLGADHLPAEQVGGTGTVRSGMLGPSPYLEEALRWLPDSLRTTDEQLVTDAQWIVDEEHTGDNRIEPALPRPSILVVDDNADMRDYLKRLLRSRYTVETAENGAVALTMIEAWKPDLVLSDIMMPELDGFQLLQALRTEPTTSAIPIILLSARAGEEAAIVGLEAGADDYLVKPFSARELLARISAHLEMAKIRQEAAQHARQHAENLQKLAEASLAINATLSSEELLWLITSRARSIIGVHQAIINRVTNEDWSRAINAVSLSEKYAYWRDYDAPINGSGIYELVCKNNKPMRMTQAELEHHPAWRNFGKEAGEHPPLRGWLAVPLIGRNGRNLGLIQLSDKYDGGEFSEEDEAVLVQLAQLASVAIENAQLYQQAQEALRARDEMFSIVSHDLKNPVGTVKGYAQLLKRHISRTDNVNTQQLIDGLTKIDETATKMTSLINELLDHSRLQIGHTLTLDFHPTDLVSLVTQVTNELQQTTQQHNLLVETPVQEIIGIWDAVHLERVFVNLISNAIKYSLAGGDICVSISQEDMAVQVSIRDTGLGIPDSDLPHIFEQFHRGGNVLTKIKGTGIGLASALQIVEQHGGTITVESTEGEGSTFIIRLPMVPAHFEHVHP